MQVKTYIGVSTQEVLAQIKAELGPDAVILGTRTFRKNGVRCHEVTAGIERSPMSAPSAAKGSAPAAAPASAPAGTPPGWNEWHKEWMQIKEHLFALMKPSIQPERLTPRQRVALEYLQREGVSDMVALDLYRRLLAAPGASVLESLGDMAPVRTWGLTEWEQRVHCVTGPFGAGKTTTALRLALALRKERPDLRIAFINADCHRGNGRLVLRHWAELSDFSYFEAQDAPGMEKALVAAAGADRIFVDMPGLGREATLAECLASLGLGGEDMATHLVLAPLHDSAHLSALLARYALTGESSLVWAKLDEAVSYGALVNVAAACGVPVSALSYGPGLRDTLAPATESLLWRLIFKRQLPGEPANAA